MRIRRLRRGFTLVDGLIGISLVLVAALVFVTAFPLATEGRAASAQNGLALAAAQEQMEFIRNIPFDSVQDQDFETPNVPNGHGHVEVTNVTGTPQLKQVDVRIQWVLGDEPKELVLTTYVTDH